MLKTGKIILHGEEVAFAIKRNDRAKKITMRLLDLTQISVSIPKYGTITQAQKFILANISWVKSQREKMRTSTHLHTQGTKAEFTLYKDRALELASQKLADFNKIYGYHYKKVTIKKHRTLWGSCSRLGNLNFNYKIALLSEDMCDYLIVHELCHLREFNHSQKFWDLVGVALPNYKTIKKKFRE